MSAVALKLAAKSGHNLPPVMALPAPPPPSGSRLLLAAVEKENGDAVAKLLSKAATAAAAHAAAHTASASAAADHSGSSGAAAAMVAACPEVNFVDPLTGRTPLIVAVANNSQAMVSLLLQYGADPNARGGSGVTGATALHIAARVGASTKLCDLLLCAGADANARDDTGATALIEAAKRGAWPAIVAFGKYKADARLTDRAGFSAHYYAKKGGHHAVAEKLPVVAFDVWNALSKAPDFAAHMQQVLQSVKKKKKKVPKKDQKKKW